MDDIPWDGPRCPDCDRELTPEALASSSNTRVVYVCPTHGAVSIVVDPFGGDAA